MSPEGPEASPLARWTGFTIRRAPFVLGGWLLVVLALNVFVPQLEEVVARDSTPFVPETAPSLTAVTAMDQEFGNGRSRSFVAVVVERPGGLQVTDRRYVADLAGRLATDDENVTYVQDLSDAQVRQSLTSSDGEAMYFQVGLPSHTGVPSSVAQVEAIREAADRGRPAGLEVVVTGASATVTDMVVEVESSIVLITAVTIVGIALILFLIYRSWAVTGLILTVIGLALAAARGATALLGQDLMSVSTFTGSFLTAVLLGATTDYAIFLVSRYQELRRLGVEPVTAARDASAKVAAVIIGSAATVVLAMACLGLANVGLFRTTGPPIAVGVLLALGIALSITPPLLAFLGSRGWLEPRPRSATATARWTALGRAVVTRPGRVLLAGLVPLVALAALFPLLQPSYDIRRVQPSDTESNRGYDVMDAHYPRNEILPDFVLIRSDRDLRNSKDLAVLEAAAAAAEKVPGVASVRGVTRPTGETIEAGSLGRQAGRIGTRLARAADRLDAGQADTGRLVDGADRLDDGAGRLAAGARDAAAGADALLGGVRRLHDGLEQLASGSGAAVTGSRELRDGAAALAAGLDTAVAQTRLAVDGLGLAHQALTRSVTCGLDPVCRRARAGIEEIHRAERDRLVPGLEQAARGARALADGAGDLDGGLRIIRAGLQAAETGSARLARAQRELGDGLDRLDAGTSRLADATGQVAAGTGRLAGSLGDLRTGLDQAARYLRGAAVATTRAGSAGFYLPPSAFDDARFALASGAYLSDDGKVARLIVLGGTNAFGRPAADRAGEVTDAVETALADTPLAGSDVAITGMAATNADIAEYSQHDFTLVALAALLAVFLVLLVLIRSLVAALFLLVSVVLSYAATMGLAVLVFQVLLDIPIEWTVACIAFVILVAVGADYNLLLIKRVHEESPDGSREGIARAVGLTGGVITAAGVIFAASMFALTSGTVTTLVQLGLTVGTGLLIDTFVIRTVVVPAFAALAGPRLWWPSRAAA